MFFSWELLSQILDQAKPNRNDLAKWYCDMEEYCRQLGFKNLKLRRKKLFSGAIPFGITVLSNMALALLEKRFFNSSIISQVIGGTTADTIKDVGIPKIAEILSLSTPQELKQEMIKNKEKKETVKTLISQVSLLKEDYNHKK